MAAPLYSTADYTAAVQALLPRGRVWPRDPDATMTRVARAIAAGFSRSNARANYLLQDAFPATAVELLPEWISALGVPGPFGTLAPTTEGQQAQVVAALSNVGGQSAEYFIQLLASYGRVATITNFTRYTVRKPVNAPIAGDAWAHSWLVDIAGAPDANLEALVRLHAPAHTIVAFTYH